MKKKIDKGTRRLIAVLSIWVAVILSAMILEATGHCSGWAAQVAIAIAFGRLCFLFGWGCARQGWGWRV